MSLFNKFLRRAGAALLVLALLFLFAEYILHRSGSRKLDEATAALDDAEPGWRLNDLEAARAAAQPPPDANSAPVLLHLHERIPTWWNAHRMHEAAPAGYTNRTPSFSMLLWMIPPAEPTRELRQAARDRLLRPEVLNQKGGFTKIQFPDNPFGTLLPHCQKTREVAGVVEYSSRLSALEGRTDLALRDARTLLVIGRSIGDEPFLISHLVRLAVMKLAVNAALQSLAWGESKSELAELQAELLAEAEFNGLAVGLRGERAVIDKVFESLLAGKVRLNELGGDANAAGGLGGAVGFQVYRGLLPGDRAKSLELLTSALEAAKLPPHERVTALKNIPMPPGPPDDFRYLVSRLIMPSWWRIAETSVRVRAELLTAAVAIACERHRLATGRWPESLEQIPKDILPQVPLDPFTGQPLRFAKLDDGIAVYGVDVDEQPERREQRRTAGDPLVELGVGAKLWNPLLRGLRPDRNP